MRDSLGCAPGDLIACTGPSAGPAKYEVGPEVYEAMLARQGPGAKHFFIGAGPKRYLDLRSANAAQLMAAGVDFLHVYSARICTITRHDRYPSHRADGPAARRFVSAIGIRA